ncbi:MAG: TetR/AcrR family transcriptional regulator, partial [Desulfosalsimonas sp.]
MLDAVMERVRERMLANAAAVREEVPGALERLRMLLFRHVAMLVENRAFVYVIFASLSYNENPKRREFLKQTICDYREAVERIVAEGQSGGEIRKDVSSQT